MIRSPKENKVLSRRDLEVLLPYISAVGEVIAAAPDEVYAVLRARRTTL